jgi:flagellar biosynthesis/type III secretory pathway protein FliH
VLPAIVTEKTQGEVNPKDAEILRALGEAIKDALAGREEFDILVNDESLKPGYVERYQRVIWIGE